MATALVVNLRFLIFSAAWPGRWRAWSPGLRWLCGYLLTDGCSPPCSSACGRSPIRRGGWGLSGAVPVVCAGWRSSTLVGVLAAGSIPRNWSLEFMASIALLVLLVPMARMRPMLVSAATGGVLVVVLRGMPPEAGGDGGHRGRHRGGLCGGTLAGPGGAAMSDDAGLWLIFVLIGLATTLPRASFIVLGERASLPDVVQRAPALCARGGAGGHRGARRGAGGGGGGGVQPQAGRGDCRGAGGARLAQPVAALCGGNGGVVGAALGGRRMTS